MLKDNSVQFAFDNKKSFISIQVFAAGIASVVAHSPKFAARNFTGKLAFDPGFIEKAALQMSLAVRSLEILDEVTASERREIERVMFEEVLEASKYPCIEYRSVRVSSPQSGDSLHRIAGELTLHGVTRTVPTDLQVVVNEGILRAQGSFSLQQTDFGLKIASVAGGTLKLKDELKCTCFIVGSRI
jgi:polyisoprenoid-binding protein YceI